MAKRTPPNNRPWPENLIFDFNLAASTTSDEAEAFINSLPTSEKNKTFIPASEDILSEPTDDLSSLAMEDKMAMEPSDDPESTSGVEVKLPEQSIEPVSTPAMADKMTLELSANPASNPAVEDRVARGRSPEPLISKPAVTDKIAPTSTQQTRPLSHNLLSIRRALSLTPEEFARPIIEGLLYSGWVASQS